MTYHHYHDVVVPHPYLSYCYIPTQLSVSDPAGFSQVPFKFIPKEIAGLAAIPSFGLGALVAGILVTLACLGRWKGVSFSC